MNDIKIKFLGMGSEDKFIINILRKKYKISLSDNPDFVIYSALSDSYINYDCVRIAYYFENLVPDFNLCDYGIAFSDISFADRYFRYPLYFMDDFKAYTGDDYANDLERALHKHENVEDKIKQKTEFCSFVYSNAEAVPCREIMYRELSKYKKINSGGRYMNNIGGPVDSKLDFQLKHKFVLAFENTSTPGYTTEKIVHAFSANAVPIYWGNPDIYKEFRKGSFINCHDFGLTEKGEPEAIEKIIEEVKRIDNDDELYKQMLETPAFAEGYDVAEKKKEFEEFLFNIFDQEPEKAFRRNRYYWGERYERKQRIGNKFYWMCRKVIPIRDFLRRLF